ncbi:MAG TPA: hypothetical protein VFM68_01130 [Candidatus Saccharimonadales bacterium]|nr:hypothetical protein [Candidatus Saccharimonadales bacterium]
MEISLITIKKTVVNFLRRYHVVLFSVIVLGGLVVAVFVLNTIITSSAENDNYIPTENSVSFDQETIERVNQLKSRDEAQQELDLSQGRINPFVE